MPEQAEIFSEILLQFYRILFIYTHFFLKKLNIRADKELLKDRTMPSNYRTFSNLTILILKVVTHYRCRHVATS